MIAFALTVAIVAGGVGRGPGPAFKITIAAMIAAGAIDTWQTAACVRARRCVEINPIARPFAGNPWALAGAKGAATSAVAVAAWRARRRHPRAAWILLGSVTAANVAVVISNHRQLRRAQR